MFPELHVTERLCSRKPGSLKSIVLVDPDDLVSQPDWFLAPTIGDLNFSSGKAAYAFEDDRLTGRLEDTTNLSAQSGDFFEYTLTARVRGVRAEVELLRAKLRNRRVHVVATYYDGSQRYVPNMRFSVRADSADRPSGHNGYTFTATARLLQPAPFLNAAIEVIGGPYVPADVVEAADVNMVEISTTDPTYTYPIPSGLWLVGWEVRSDSAQSVSLGTTASGTELGGPVDVDADQVWVGQGNMLPTFGTVNIYFSGLEGVNTIRLWLLG